LLKPDGYLVPTGRHWGRHTFRNCQKFRARHFSTVLGRHDPFEKAIEPETAAVAVDDVEPGEWFDPTFLQRIEPTAIKVTIGEGEKKTQDFRVGGG
jgi:hypothetical protein